MRSSVKAVLGAYPKWLGPFTSPMTRVMSSNKLPVPEKPSMDDIEITTCPFVSADRAFTSSISCCILAVML